jgi:hypothetical protein
MIQAPKQYQIVQVLRNLVQRVRAQSAGYSDLDALVSPPHGLGQPYTIDISDGRFSRRVWVDTQTAHNLQSGMADARLSRELRSTMMTVSRLALRRN